MRIPRLILSVAALALPLAAHAASAGAVGENLLWLALILMAARLFAPLAQRFGFPAVLGELLLGVVLGNLSLLGIGVFDGIARDPIVAFIAELGVIVLLLQIGLETRLADLARVGGRASAVAAVGVVVPFLIGVLLAGPLLLPGLEQNTYLFLGATLAATSVGITGRVFRDLGQLHLPAARIVLGAAVIDDVLGLVILAVVSSLVAAGSVSFAEILWIVAKSMLFLIGSIGIGRLIARQPAAGMARIDQGQSMLFAQVLAAGLFFAWLAHAVGLAPLIGAFAAGLLFEPVFLKDFRTPRIVAEIEPLLAAAPPAVTERVKSALLGHTRHQHEHMLEPIGYFFVPVFFVLTGMQVDLRAFADPTVLAVALGITVAAIAGKLAAGLCAGKGARWLVGWGMVPRGEVGLIFAMAGKSLGVMDETLFSAVVVMVILTTLITPPMLIRLLASPGRPGEN